MTTARSFRFLLLFSSLFFLFDRSITQGQSDHPDSLLLEASLNGETEEVERLLNEGANQDARREGDYWTPLMFAAMNGYTEITRMLLAHDANPNLGNDEEGTPLCVAASSFILPPEGPNAIIDLLLEAGADLNGSNGSRMTALMYAAREGKTSTIERLLEAGADPNYEDVREWSALWMAVRSDQAEGAEVLLEAGSDPDVQAEMSQWTALSIATQNNNTEMARLLLQAGAEPNGRPSGNDYFAPPIWFAAQHNNLEVVRLLLERNAVPNYSDGGYFSEDEKPRTPLDWAKEHGNDEMEKLLREAGAVDDLQGVYRAMLKAVREDDAQEFRKLMAQRIDPRRYIFDDEESITLLSEAAQRGNIEIVKEIFSFPLPPNSYELYGAYETAVEIVSSELAEEILRFAPGDMALQAVDASQPELLGFILEIDPDAANYPGWEGQTPLHLAAQVGDIAMVSMLLEAGAQVNIPDRWGESPLFVSARIGSTEIGEVLLEWGADIEHRSKNGMTPLHAAVLAEQDEMIVWLLEHDANLYSTDYQGWNALHFAAWGAVASTVQLLLDLGIEPEWKTDQGETPLDLADRVENYPVQAILRGEE